MKKKKKPAIAPLLRKITALQREVSRQEAHGLEILDANAAFAEDHVFLKTECARLTEALKERDAQLDALIIENENTRRASLPVKALQVEPPKPFATRLRYLFKP